MPNEKQDAETPQAESPDPVISEVGNAVELTEGTSSRSGTEDKRYKYQ
ncbi:hypothetical protein ABZ635_01760 [Nocardiopsis sp. NPDC007018]